LAFPTVPRTIVEHFVAMLNAHFAKNLSPDNLLEMGRQVLAEELAFNEAAGLPSDKIYLADFLFRESLPPRESTFDVDREEIKKMWEALR
jgi:aldehyde:ferredoxin oxidoreductase